MRMTIEIDTAKLEAAMSAGPYKTKKEAIEAGLELIARPANYREILKWQGKLKWEGDDNIDWCAAARGETVPAVATKPAPKVVSSKPKRVAR
jgi:antitoxin ParD1/3/4